MNYFIFSKFSEVHFSGFLCIPHFVIDCIHKSMATVQNHVSPLWSLKISAPILFFSIETCQL